MQNALGLTRSMSADTSKTSVGKQLPASGIPTLRAPMAAGNAGSVVSKTVEDLQRSLAAEKEEKMKLTVLLQELQAQISIMMKKSRETKEEARRDKEKAIRHREEYRRDMALIREENTKLLAQLMAMKVVTTTAGSIPSASLSQRQQSSPQPSMASVVANGDTASTSHRVTLTQSQYRRAPISNFVESDGIWREVTRRKSRRSDNRRNERESTQYQQSVHQPQQSSRDQQHGAQHRPQTTRPNRQDIIEVTSFTGKMWYQVYKQIREAPEMEKMNEKLHIGRRTAKLNLRMKVARSIDSSEAMARIQGVLRDEGSVRVLTQMTEVIITNVDPLANDGDIRSAIGNVTGSASSIATIQLWQLSDGTQRARVCLPLAHAKLIIRLRLKVLYTMCAVKEAPHTPIEKLRCYRCLERGHVSRDCHSPVNHSNVCIRCGTSGHLAATCEAEVRCASCAGPHRMGSAQCVQSNSQ
uniref:Gag-like protein n=1 Tax=Anopheles gambiae TaxID=7165 RepID=Q868R1_ANOGA|nr:gag-like protein [Anopheles gambiae]